jgi:hypothetical protein
VHRCRRSAARSRRPRRGDELRLGPRRDRGLHEERRARRSLGLRRPGAARRPEPARPRARRADPPLARGTGRRLRTVWYLRLDQRRALLVGPHGALASGPPIGKGRDRSDLPHKDIGPTVAILSIIGPRAARLLAAADLPGEVAIGAVGRDSGDASIVAIVRESQRRFLVLVRTPAADTLWTRLLAAGEPLGAAFVGLDALTLLGASSVSGN